MSINLNRISKRAFLLKASVLLLLTSLVISFLILPWVSINRIRFLAAIVTFLMIFWGLYFRKVEVKAGFKLFAGRYNLQFQLIESKAKWILISFTVLVIFWFGLDVFMNPYLFDYNHGNGAYFAQVLHNLYSGLGPENTVKYNEVLFYRSNPYYYASAFSAVPHVLPCILLPILYAVFPFPPMHVFAVVTFVLIFGPLGIYTAVRALEGSKTLSLVGAIGYGLLPWVERSIFFHGHFDVLSFAVYPYVFASLFSRRWPLFYASVFLLATINLPYTYSAIAIGIMAAVFFKAPRHGFVVIIIGLSVLFWDQAIIRESLKGIWDVSRRPEGTLLQLFLDLDAGSFLKAVLFHLLYTLLLVMTVGFIPLLGIRSNNRWNWPVIGILLFAVVGVVMGLFRSYDLASHRNANMVVPIYLSAFMVLAEIFHPKDSKLEQEDHKAYLAPIVFLLIAGLVSMTLWFSNHYPWAGVTNKGILSLNYFTSSPVTEKYGHVLEKMKEFVPEDASVAYRIDAAIQAYITNRQKAWYLGYHPDGVEYFFVQTKDIVYIDKNLPPWREYLDKVEHDKNNIVLYKDDGLVIYKNLNPKPIPRLESVLGWNILLKALIPDRYSGAWLR